MNVIFALCFSVCTLILLFTDPDGALAAMLSGGEKALALTLKMTVIYAVWLGIFELAERSRLTEKFALLLKPVNRFLFGELPEKANEYISLNISANMLGMSGATTPMGIKSIRELEKYRNTEYQIAMFFVINATSIQILPTSVLALRTSLNAAAPSDIILPTILATAVSTAAGILLVKMFLRKKRK